ncbi:MAG: ABC transporter substrate-binding protein [Neorhizobium sp.]|nr:ABC transporter substrate-binding protein [Neorhizobium sp.]
MVFSFTRRGFLSAAVVAAGLSSAGFSGAGTALAADKANPDARRIVAIGGTVTEILYDLGAQDRIVARDSTSSYPADAMSKPDVGYMRALSPEGILGQKPDLIVMEEGSGPPPAVEVLKASEVPVVIIPTPPDVSKIADKIRAVGKAVGLADKAEALAKKTEDGLKALEAEVAAIKTQKKNVLFVLSVSNGRLMAGGKDTSADAIIGLAGGANAAGSITGYKPLSDEAVIAAKPDVVLQMQAVGDHSVSAETLFAMPSMQTTPAAANKARVQMDGLLLLGLGPRTPDAARQLAAALYPGAIN